MTKHTRKKRRKKRIIHNNKRENKGLKTEQELAQVERTLGAFLIAWGNIEVSIRTLELMLTEEDFEFSVKSEDTDGDWYQPSKLFFQKRLEKVLPGKSGLIEQLLQLSNIRNFIVHNPKGGIIPLDSSEVIPVIIHADLHASAFAQNKWVGEGKLYAPKMKFTDGQYITMEEINKATDDLKNVNQSLADIIAQIGRLGTNNKTRLSTIP